MSWILPDKETLRKVYETYKTEKEMKEQADIARQQALQSSLLNQATIAISNNKVTTAINPGMFYPAGQYTGDGSAKQVREANLKELIKNPAMQASLDDLENLWTAKFGSEWVTGNDLHDTNDYTFWDIACRRLAKADRLEEFDIVKAYQVVYRLCR